MAAILINDELAEVKVISQNGIVTINQCGSVISMSDDDFDLIFKQLAEIKGYKKSWIHTIKQELAIRLRLNKWL